MLYSCVQIYSKVLCYTLLYVDTYALKALYSAIETNKARLSIYIYLSATTFYRQTFVYRQGHGKNNLICYFPVMERKPCRSALTKGKALTKLNMECE